MVSKAMQRMLLQQQQEQERKCKRASTAASSPALNSNNMTIVREAIQTKMDELNKAKEELGDLLLRTGIAGKKVEQMQTWLETQAEASATAEELHKLLAHHFPAAVNNEVKTWQKISNVPMQNSEEMNELQAGYEEIFMRLREDVDLELDSMKAFEEIGVGPSVMEMEMEMDLQEAQALLKRLEKNATQAMVAKDRAKQELDKKEDETDSIETKVDQVKKIAAEKGARHERNAAYYKKLIAEWMQAHEDAVAEMKGAPEDAFACSAAFEAAVDKFMKKRRSDRTTRASER